MPAIRKAARPGPRKATTKTVGGSSMVSETYLAKRRRLTERLKNLRNESEALSISSHELLTRLS